MALKIRLRQQGRTNRTVYRLVVTDSRSPRDGKYVEAVGWYNPIEVEDDKKLSIKSDRIQHWIGLGAQMTHSAKTLIAKTAPDIVRGQTERKLAHRAKAAAKRKAKKAAA
jgi:small subunit ribosomal protein S16